MVFILDMVKVDNHLPVIVDPIGCGPSACENHLKCGPVVVGIGNLGFDTLSKMQ
jgi:hypothetical protein